MMRKLMFIAALSLAFVGCATVSDSGVAPAQNANSAQAPSKEQAAAPVKVESAAAAPVSAVAQDSLFVPKDDVAIVYIFRNQSIGMAIGMNVELDGQNIGKTGAKRYIRAEVQPGAHILTCTTESKSVLPFNAEAGKIYYVWQQVKMGVLVARNDLQLVNEATGQKGVNACKPVEVK